MDEDEGGGGDIPEWVVTFGDMMSLLLTFFIMLVSMSEIKQEERIQLMMESMRQHFGHDASRASMIPGDSTPMNSSMPTMASMGRAKRKDIMRGGSKVKSATGEDNLVRIVRPGQDATVGGTVFFDEDSAELKPEAQAALLGIAEQLAGKPQKIEVRGHASRKPVAGTDHWSLGHQRSNAVMRFLVEKGRINAERFRLGSAGSHEPLDTDIDEESRKRNARVEVLMWDEPIRRQRNTT